jgi:hypothetical protein
VLLHQPERDPVVITTAPAGDQACPPRDCTDAAGTLLGCLGLADADVKSVRVNRVSLEVDLCSADPEAHSDCAQSIAKPSRKPCCKRFDL